MKPTPNKLSKAQLKNLEVAKAVNRCGGKIRATTWGGRQGHPRHYGYRVGSNPVILKYLGQAITCAVDCMVDQYK